MTDAQSRTHRPRIVEHYSDMQVRVSFISCSEASRFCKAIEGGSFTIYPVVQASHPTPRRDEHITRMLDQLSGGVGMFLQEDGVGLSEYVQELEDNSARTQALYDVLNNMCVRTATTYPGKTETFAEAVQWMKENVIDNLVRKQNEINRQVHRACMAENELADLKRQIAEKECDGCKAGIPVDAFGRHRMAHNNGYRDLMVCQASKYATATPDASRELALIYAGLESAADILISRGSYGDETTAQDIKMLDCNEIRAAFNKRRTR